MRDDFWLLFAAVDARRGVVEKAWLVPSDRFNDLAGYQTVGGQLRRRFSASAKSGSKDQWTDFRIEGPELPQRMLEVVRALESHPTV